MKIRIASLLPTSALALLLPVAGFTQPLPVNDALVQRVIEWRRDIHQHPELSNREFRTSAKVAEHLRSLGLTPKTGIAHTGVTAILKGARPGPRMAIRADMDALPVTERVDVPFASKATDTYRGGTVGVMHACGHDAHTAILMGVAEALAGMKDQLAGEVMFLFQPAEEGPPDGEDGGAPMMLAEGVFDEFKPEAIFALHVVANLPTGIIGVRPGPITAGNDSFAIRIHGQQTHGSMPWSGIDPIVATAELITSAQAIVSRRIDISKLPAVVTFGAVNGGVRYNIIPDEVELLGTIRTFDENVREAILADLRNVAEHVAVAHGAQADTRLVPLPGGNPVLFNDLELTARMRPSLIKAVGAERVIERPPGMPSEDHAHFAKVIPSMYFEIGVTPPERVGKAALNHSPEFYLDEAALEPALRAMLQVSLDYLNGGN